MIIYSAMSTYQLLECIVHRMLIHPAEESILLLYPFILEKVPSYKKLEGPVFKQVSIIDSVSIKSEEQVLADVDAILKKTLPCPIDTCTEIYIAGVHAMLGVYLLHHHIPFHMFEDGNGALSRPEVLAEINQKACSQAHWEICEKYQVFYPIRYTSKQVKSKICNMNAQREGFSDPLAVHFDLVENFKRLNLDSKELILDLFNCPKNVPVASDSTLLLTQHFSNLKQLSFEDHALIYQILYDYFFSEKNLIIKPHPDDIMFYDYLLPGVQIIREKFPSELLPFIFDQFPHTLSTVSSTGVYLIQDCFEEKLFFDAAFEKYFKSLIRYDYACQIFIKLGFHTIYSIDTLSCILHNLQSTTYAANLCISDELCGCYLVDDIGDQESRENLVGRLLQADEDDVFIFLNSNSEYRFYEFAHKDAIFKHIVPIVIQKEILREDYRYAEVEEEVIYFYSKSERYKKMVENMNLEKDLNATGIKTMITSLTKDQLRIKILEGQLAATEERLLHYINAEKERMGQ